MFPRNRFTKLAIVAAILAPFAGLSHATYTPPDVSAVVTAVEGASTPIGLIGGAVLIVMVGIKVYKWVRRAM